MYRLPASIWTTAGEMQIRSVVPACNPSILEAETWGPRQVQGPPGLQSVLQVSRDIQSDHDSKKNRQTTLLVWNPYRIKRQRSKNIFLWELGTTFFLLRTWNSSCCLCGWSKPEWRLLCSHEPCKHPSQALRPLQGQSSSSALVLHFLAGFFTLWDNSLLLHLLFPLLLFFLFILLFSFHSGFQGSNPRPCTR